MKFTIKSNMKKKAAFVKMDLTDYMDMLISRLNDAINWWGGDAERELKDQFIDLIRDYLPGANVPDVSVIADNWVVNGEFIERDEFTENGNYASAYNRHNGNWEQLCKTEGIIYNDNYCCVGLGFDLETLR